MAMSRPFVLAVLAAILASATFISMRSAGERAQANDSKPAPTVRSPSSSKGTATSSASKPAKPVQTQAGTPTKVPATKAPVSKVTPAKPATKKKAADAGVPPKVQRALDAERTVVLFFRQSGADDDATASAVRSLHGTKRVSVFTSDISKLARYRRVISDLGVTQAPAVVIVGKDRKATLLEGFVDKGTLKQRVEDAR